MHQVICSNCQQGSYVTMRRGFRLADTTCTHCGKTGLRRTSTPGGSPNKGKTYQACAGCGKRGLYHKAVPFTWTRRYGTPGQDATHPQDSMACHSCTPVPATGRLAYHRTSALATRLLGRSVRWATAQEAKELADHPARRHLSRCPACGPVVHLPGSWNQGFHDKALACERGNLRLDCCESCGHTLLSSLILTETRDSDIPAALVMLIGAPGSGKSTWRSRRFTGDQVFNADEIRGILTGDPSDQVFNDEVFTVGEMYLRERMRCGLLTVEDSTNSRPEHRLKLVRLARNCDVPVIAVLCHPPLEVALARNQARDRVVPDHVVERMHGNITASLPTLPLEADYLVGVGDIPELYRPADGQPWLHYHPYSPGRTYTLAAKTPDPLILAMIAGWDHH